MKAEMTLRCWGLLKSIAVAKGILTPLACEKLIPTFNDTAFVGEWSFEVGLMKKADIARAKIADIMKKQKTSSADEMDGLITKQSSNMKLADPTWQVEESIYKLISGADAENRFKGMFVALLPSAEKPVDTNEALIAASAMATADAFVFAPRGIQEATRHVVTMLTRLAEGSCPKLPTNASPFVREVFAHFQWFMRFEFKGRNFGGSEAMTHLIDHLKNLEKSKSDITPSLLTPLVQYRWLIPSGHVKWADNIEKTLQTQASEAASKRYRTKGGQSVKFHRRGWG